MELRVTLRGRPAVLREQTRVIKVDGVITLFRGVHIFDGKILTDRSFLIERLPTNLERHLVDAGGFEPRRKTWVHSVDADTAIRRVTDGGLRVADRKHLGDESLTVYGARHRLACRLRGNARQHACAARARPLHLL